MVYGGLLVLFEKRLKYGVGLFGIVGEAVQLVDAAGHAALSHDGLHRVDIAREVGEHGVLEEQELFAHDLHSILVEEFHLDDHVALQPLVLVA